MKVNKTQALLYIYSLLIKEKKIVKSNIMSKLEISDLTFVRYIQELRAYIYNFFTGYEIIYVKKDDMYVLVQR